MSRNKETTEPKDSGIDYETLERDFRTGSISYIGDNLDKLTSVDRVNLPVVLAVRIKGKNLLNVLRYLVEDRHCDVNFCLESVLQLNVLNYGTRSLHCPGSALNFVLNSGCYEKPFQQCVAHELKKLGAKDVVFDKYVARKKHDLAITKAISKVADLETFYQLLHAENREYSAFELQRWLLLTLTGEILYGDRTHQQYIMAFLLLVGARPLPIDDVIEKLEPYPWYMIPVVTTFLNAGASPNISTKNADLLKEVLPELLIFLRRLRITPRSLQACCRIIILKTLTADRSSIPIESKLLAMKSSIGLIREITNITASPLFSDIRFDLLHKYGRNMGTETLLLKSPFARFMKPAEHEAAAAASNHTKYYNKILKEPDAMSTFLKDRLFKFNNLKAGDDSRNFGWNLKKMSNRRSK